MPLTVVYTRRFTKSLKRVKQFKGFKESKGQMPTEKSFQESWAQYKTKENVTDWESLTPAQQDAHRDAFQGAEKNKFSEMNKKKSGFWISIFSAFYDSFQTSNRNNLN